MYRSGAPKTSLSPKVGSLCLMAMIATVLLVARSVPASADDWVISSAEASIPQKPIPLSAQTIVFSIKPQPLESALDAFGVATGIELLYGANLTAGRNSSGVV